MHDTTSFSRFMLIWQGHAPRDSWNGLAEASQEVKVTAVTRNDTVGPFATAFLLYYMSVSDVAHITPTCRVMDRGIKIFVLGSPSSTTTTPAGMHPFLIHVDVARYTYNSTSSVHRIFLCLCPRTTASRTVMPASRYQPICIVSW